MTTQRLLLSPATFLDFVILFDREDCYAPKEKMPATLNFKNVQSRGDAEIIFYNHFRHFFLP